MALIDVEKAVSMFKKVEVPILGIIENMSYHVCPNCGHHDEIFSRGGQQLAQTLVDFLGEIPSTRACATAATSDGRSSSGCRTASTLSCSWPLVSASQNR